MLTPMKAIRAKCLDCCCGSAHEVKLCTCQDCTLYPYRFGKNPNIRYELTPARRAALERGILASQRPTGSGTPTANVPSEGSYTPDTHSSANALVGGQ